MLRYSMLIQWSDEDQCYLVSLPEWPNLIGEAPARGDTYEEAARNGRAVLEKLPDSAIKTEPWTYKPIVYADKEEALKRFREEIMPRHDELFRELAAIEQKEQEETQDDKEVTVESILVDILAFVKRAEKRTNYPTTPETKKFLRMCADGMKESITQLEIAIEKRPLGRKSRH